MFSLMDKIGYPFSQLGQKHIGFNPNSDQDALIKRYVNPLSRASDNFLTFSTNFQLP